MTDLADQQELGPTQGSKTKVFRVLWSFSHNHYEPSLLEHSSGRMMFPLPLAPFEEYMLIDDRPTHPMSFFLKFAFSGTCDREALDAALPIALERHPLLSANIEESSSNRWQWSNTHGKTVATDWIPSHGGPRTTSIDLFTEPGLRISARHLDLETELVFQFHHACCDAIGALRFIEDLLVAYSTAIDEPAKRPPFRPIDEQRLMDRARLGMTPWKLLGMIHKQAVGLLGARQFLMRQPVPIQPITSEAATAALPTDFPSAHAHQFSQAETSRLVTTAREAGATVNDLLCRDLFLAMGDFRANRQLGDGSEWLRLSVPMNLRNHEDQQLSAANFVSMVFLDRQPHGLDDGQALLNGIGHEMRLIKKNQLGHTFPLSLRFTRSLPGAIRRLRQMSEKQACRVTAVLSNLGLALLDVPLPRDDGKIICGEMTLERFEFLPPVRPYTTVALGASSYAGRLQIALHFDPRCLTNVDANELMKAYLDRLRKAVS